MRTLFIFCSMMLFACMSNTFKPIKKKEVVKPLLDITHVDKEGVYKWVMVDGKEVKKYLFDFNSKKYYDDLN